MSDATATADAAKRHPPKPPFALTVGVVGHRPRDLAKDPPNGEVPAPREERLKKIEDDVSAALKVIKNAATQSREDYAAYFCQEPVLTLVSALAEGADTIAADVALDLGYELDAPLPFAREDYESDFETAKAKANLNRLLGRARRVLELPGRRSSAAGTVEDSRIEANRAYEAAGLTVLSQSGYLVGNMGWFALAGTRRYCRNGGGGSALRHSHHSGGCLRSATDRTTLARLYAGRNSDIGLRRLAHC